MASGGNIANLLGMAKTAEIGGNYEEALAYFNRVLEIDSNVTDAWIGKGRAAGWLSTLANIRIKEALIAFNHAIANATPDQKESVTSLAVSEVNSIAVALYRLARNHMIEFVSVNDIWGSYLNQVAQLIDALEAARVWQPSNRTTLENIVNLCKDNIEGYSYRDPYNNNAPAAHSINAQYEQFLRERLRQSADGIRLIDPNYVPPTIQKKTADACFVVTATMGNINHPDVILLRSFRDQMLLVNPVGKIFVNAYYAVGPWLAKVISKSQTLRRVSRRTIVKPAVRFATKKLDNARQG